MGNSSQRGQQIYSTPARPKVLPLPAALLSGWHQANIERYPDLTPMRNIETAHRVIHNGFNQLLELRQKPDPKKTFAAHFDDVKRHSEQLQRSIRGVVDRARNDARQSIDAINSKIIIDLNLFPREDATEIRSALRSMTLKNRSEAIAKMISSGDGAALAAVLNGHEITSGVSKQEADSRRNQFIKQHAPELVAKRDALQYSADKLIDGFAVGLEFTDEITDPGQNEWSIQADEATNAIADFQSVINAIR